MANPVIIRGVVEHKVDTSYGGTAKADGAVRPRVGQRVVYLRHLGELGFSNHPVKVDFKTAYVEIADTVGEGEIVEWLCDQSTWRDSKEINNTYMAPAPQVAAPGLGLVRNGTGA